MSYDWPRIHKVEDNYEQDICDTVLTHVLEHFGVDDLSQITEEQISEVIAFRLQLNEYSVMQWGYSWVCSTWENEVYEEENE